MFYSESLPMGKIKKLLLFFIVLATGVGFFGFRNQFRSWRQQNFSQKKNNFFASNIEKKKYVIVGASAAGIAAAEQLRWFDRGADVTCVSYEKERPYNKCNLEDYLAGEKTLRHITILNERRQQWKNIDLILGDHARVVSINPKKKSIKLASGEALEYGVFTYQTLSDVSNIKDYLYKQRPQKVAVVGAGFSGLECADALLSFDVATTVIDRNGRVMHRRCDEKGSQILQAHMKKKGVAFLKNESVKEVFYKDGKITKILLSSGKHLDVDMLILSIGFKQNVELARGAGLEIHKLGGIKVDASMRTSNKHIFAGGDCVVVKDIVTGEDVRSVKWRDAKEQGKVAAHGMVGKNKEYKGAFRANLSRFFGTSIVTMGPVNNPPAGMEVITKNGENSHRKYLIKNDQIKGFLVVGSRDRSLVGYLRKVSMSGQKVDRDRLI